jgi:hypothetical protein
MTASVGPAVSNPKDFPTSLIPPWVELGREDPLGPYTKVGRDLSANLQEGNPELLLLNLASSSTQVSISCGIT